MKIRFLSANELKLAEVRTILEPVGVEVVPIARRIEEIQTENEVELVRDKRLKPFQSLAARCLSSIPVCIWMGSMACPPD